MKKLSVTSKIFEKYFQLTICSAVKIKQVELPVVVVLVGRKKFPSKMFQKRWSVIIEQPKGLSVLQDNENSISESSKMSKYYIKLTKENLKFLLPKILGNELLLYLKHEKGRERMWQSLKLLNEEVTTTSKLLLCCARGIITQNFEEIIF